MAKIERINIKAMMPVVADGSTKIVEWVSQEDQVLSGVPQIFFDDGNPWLAANNYTIHKLEVGIGSKLKTVVSIMGHLKAYACWLEDQELDWRHFPRKKKDRCLVRYRGYLILQRTEGVISPSTATARMSAVVRFYRWAKVYKWIEKRDLWEDHVKVVRFRSSEGFSRTMEVQSSELSIPNRKRAGTTIEGGLTPLSTKDRNILLQFLLEKNKIELYLMFLIGFFTGARSETIRTLRLSDIDNAWEDPLQAGVARVRVGPPTHVETKGGVHGTLLFPSLLIEELKRYAHSVRRLTRQSKAPKDNVTNLFLTVRGSTYAETSFTKLASDLRKELMRSGIKQFENLKFHQSRATFGTELMKIALNTLPSVSDAIVFVRDAMLHADEATTWKYVKFIQNEPLMEAYSDDFFNVFIGKTSDFETEKLINKVTYDDNS